MIIPWYVMLHRQIKCSIKMSTFLDRFNTQYRTRWNTKNTFDTCHLQSSLDLHATNPTKTNNHDFHKTASSVNENPSIWCKYIHNQNICISKVTWYITHACTSNNLILILILILITQYKIYNPKYNNLCNRFKRYRWFTLKF